MRKSNSQNPLPKQLTPKQKEVLDFINRFADENGYAPSQQEIAHQFGFKSLGTVQNYLVRLERQGFLRKTWNARRGMQVVDQPQPPHTLAMASSVAVPLPLLGRVAAGKPIEAILTQETIDVPASMIQSNGAHFVLKVTGDSMIEDGILHGDYVVIKRQEVARNGQTVVALLGNEATIKRYYHRDHQIELHPANANYQPLIINSLVESEEGGRGFKIEGVLVGLIRKID